MGAGGGAGFEVLRDRLIRNGMPAADADQLLELVRLTLTHLIGDSQFQEAGLAYLTSRWSGELGEILLGSLGRLGADDTAKLWGGAYAAAKQTDAVVSQIAEPLEVAARGIAAFGRMLADPDGGAVRQRLIPLLKNGPEAGPSARPSRTWGNSLAGCSATRSPPATSSAPARPGTSWRRRTSGGRSGNVIAHDFIPDAAKLSELAETLIEFDEKAVPMATGWMLLRLERPAGNLNNNLFGSLYELSAGRPAPRPAARRFRVSVQVAHGGRRVQARRHRLAGRGGADPL